ncbi:unnamed protein product [Moneuplotes crassus]|uniref:PX domain-containing protein n=1 Tax=Euplotes crassus TaxID=5936 RepID=A0AAD1YAC9_EUPCR|nr:unnamed protein product [Moneuplotes crassus]
MNSQEESGSEVDVSEEGSEEFGEIPLNESMIFADKEELQSLQSSITQSVPIKENNEVPSLQEESQEPPEDNKCLLVINDSYMEEGQKQQDNKSESPSHEPPKAEEEKKDENLFISRIAEEDIQALNSRDFSNTLNPKMKNLFGDALDTQSEYCLTTQEVGYDEIKELFLSEPTWHSSSSWTKPMAHRQYKIKTIWCAAHNCDTEVRRRYSHFEWLREMLLKEYENWAVPVLPEKTIFEKASGHKSDFIQERMRKMKHFLTIVRSHRQLKQSQYLKGFLAESDQAFKATIENLKKIEEELNSSTSQKSKGWFSAASNSFGSVISKANEISKNIVPTLKNLIANSEDGFDANDKLIKKYSERLDMLHKSFIEFYKLVTNTYDKRSNDCKIERELSHFMSLIKSTNAQELQQIISDNSKIADDRGKEASTNLVELKELLYAIESHLVWIESVQDLISRKEVISDKLLNVKKELKDAPLNENNKQLSTDLVTLTERRERMIKGIRMEMKKLTKGTLDFYPRYAESKFISSQLMYYKNNFEIYQC